MRPSIIGLVAFAVAVFVLARRRATGPGWLFFWLYTSLLFLSWTVLSALRLRNIQDGSSMWIPVLTAAVLVMSATALVRRFLHPTKIDSRETSAILLVAMGLGAACCLWPASGDGRQQLDARSAGTT
ncbi:MAG: hypothetical protein R3C19_19690 [Planctomycetaceae bacterium]